MAQRKFTRVSAKTVDALVEGSIDLHAHFGPDSKIDRSVDLTTFLETATALKMRGVALKSKDYPTQPYAYLGKQQFPDIEPLGALCLDHDVGGMNPDAVKTSGRLGARIVWLPTFSSTQMRYLAHLVTKPMSQAAQSAGVRAVTVRSWRGRTEGFAAAEEMAKAATLDLGRQIGLQMASSYVPDALGRLAHEMDNASASRDRITAAKEILNQAQIGHGGGGGSLTLPSHGTWELALRYRSGPGNGAAP